MIKIQASANSETILFTPDLCGGHTHVRFPTDMHVRKPPLVRCFELPPA